MRKIAILSDIHGNATALAPVLLDCRLQAVDEFWTVGDIIARGPEPERCMSLLDTVAPTAYILGNHEQNYQKFLDAKVNEPLQPKQVMATLLTAYDRAQLTEAHFEQLCHLPLTVTKRVGPVTIRLQHALVNKPSTPNLIPTAPQANFERLAVGEPDVIIYGHTHQQVLRYSKRGQLILNAGTIGLPTNTWARLRQSVATYLMLTIDRYGLVSIDYRRVPFNWQQACQIATRSRLPYCEFYNRTLQTNCYQYTLAAIRKYNETHQMVASAQRTLQDRA